MAGISVHLKDLISGNETNIDEIDDAMSINDFFDFCSLHGFAHVSEAYSITIDGQPFLIDGRKNPNHPFSLPSRFENSLTEWGIKDGSSIMIGPEMSNCSGMGNMPIIFITEDAFANKSIRWNKTIDWYNGVSLDGNSGIQGGLALGPIWEVLPKGIDYTSVYLKLHGYNAKGEFKTFLSNKTLDEVKHMTAATLEERDVFEQGFSVGWICVLSCKPLSISCKSHNESL